mgnify:CR=1 FL=1
MLVLCIEILDLIFLWFCVIRSQRSLLMYILLSALYKKAYKMILKIFSCIRKNKVIIHIFLLGWFVSFSLYIQFVLVRYSFFELNISPSKL